MSNGILTMVLTPLMEKVIKETLNIEIEMLHADIKKLPDGRTRYQLEVSEEKGEVIKQFIVAIMYVNQMN